MSNMRNFICLVRKECIIICTISVRNISMSVLMQMENKLENKVKVVQ